ncbi:MAG: 23S rRNA pseudouridine(1911/1915/1917) synthase RluD [Woeseia sp.]|nr:23S rRNA pseudouridine(1911/1915/1917) synthase RluD [Woeseia sp.]
MSQKPLQKVIPANLTGLRLDIALARMFPEYSRSRLKRWILQQYITVDEQVMRPRDQVLGGESVVLNPITETYASSEPQLVDFKIAYEDEDLLVVNKPAGLVVHPGAGNKDGTLMNGLFHHEPLLEQLPRAGIIHRLDKETTGLLLVAKTFESHTKLVRSLAAREISREYVAICNGVLTGGGTIDAPIGRHPTNRLKMSIRDDGKSSVTHYRVLERLRAQTFVNVQLESGRTHQIRVHFAHKRHALLGDSVYGGRPRLPSGASSEVVNVMRSFRRQALHAKRLCFDQPISGKAVDIECEAPGDFKRLLRCLRKDTADCS